MNEQEVTTEEEREQIFKAQADQIKWEKGEIIKKMKEFPDLVNIKYPIYAMAALLHNKATNMDKNYLYVLDIIEKCKKSLYTIEAGKFFPYVVAVMEKYRRDDSIGEINIDEGESL